MVACGCVVQLRWSVWQEAEMLSRLTVDGIPHRCGLVMCSLAL